MAYYFAALATGLLRGLATSVSPLIIALVALIVLVMFVGDHPRLFSRYRWQTIVLDSAYTDEFALTAAFERMLGARVHGVTVIALDLVNDTTTVDARYRMEISTGSTDGVRARSGAASA